MPFKTGKPLGPDVWVVGYFLLTLLIAWLQSLASRAAGRSQESSDSEAYAGHHYQRRQAGKIFKH